MNECHGNPAFVYQEYRFTSCSVATIARQPFDEADYWAYLKWLNEGAERYGFAVHAYACMTNHTRVEDTLGIPALFLALGECVVSLGLQGKRPTLERPVTAHWAL